MPGIQNKHAVEVICPKCEGKGTYPNKLHVCTMCKGKKKIKATP